MNKILFSFALLCCNAANSQVSWQKMAGPNESAISMTVSSNNMVYASTFSYGVFQSADEGVTWTNISLGLGDSLIVALETSADGKVFAGTNAHGIYQYNSGTWTAINSGLPASNTYVTGFAKTAADSLYIMTSGEKIYSWNGAAWRDITYNFPTLGRAIATGPGGVLYAGAFASGVYKFDGINNWTIVGAAMPNNYVSRMAVSSNDTIFVACNSNNVFRCAAAGGAWTSINAGLPALNANFIGIDLQNWLFIGNSGASGLLYRSINSGDTWQLVSNNLYTTSFNCFTTAPSGKIFAGAAGVFKSINGGTAWSDMNPGMDARKVLQCFTVTANETMFAGTRIGPWRSTDNGVTWQLRNTGISHFSSLQITGIANGDLLYHGRNNVPKGAIYRSVNNGDSWTQVAANGCDLYTKIKQHKADTVWATSRFSGATSLQYSIDNGATWLNNPLKISAIWDIDFSKDNTIFLGSESEGVSRSDNGGAAFMLGVGNTIPWYGNVIEVETDVNGVIFAGSDWYQHVLWFSKPEENGDSWTKFKDPDLPVSGIQDLIFDEHNNAWLGCENGGVRMAYNTQWDSTTNWILSSGGLPSPNSDVLELCFDTAGYMYATCYTSNGHNAGLYRSTTPVNPPSSSTYTFNGNGNWDEAFNWSHSLIPPAVLSGNAMIVIDPEAGGECVLNIQQQVINGAILKVMPNRKLRITGDLIR